MDFVDIVIDKENHDGETGLVSEKIIQAFAKQLIELLILLRD
jgi:hypothetical protein